MPSLKRGAWVLGEEWRKKTQDLEAVETKPLRSSILAACAALHRSGLRGTEKEKARWCQSVYVFQLLIWFLARAVGFGFDGDAYIRENIGNICFSVCKWQNNFSVERDSVTWSARRALVINSSVRRNRMDLIKCALGWLLYMLSLLLLGERGLPLNCIVEYN